jgi:hypothetical protein
LPTTRRNRFEICGGSRGLPHAVNELDRVGDAVLHHPLDVDDIEVPGQHQGFIRKIVLGVPRGLAHRGRAETEFLLEHPLGGHVLHAVDPERQLEVEAGSRGLDHRPEAFDHRLFFRLHGVDHGQPPDGKHQEDETGNEDRQPAAQLGEHCSEVDSIGIVKMSHGGIVCGPPAAVKRPARSFAEIPVAASWKTEPQRSE